MKIRYAPLVLACALMVAGAAQAAAVTYTFGGTLDTSNVPSLAVGDTFTGTLTFDSSSIDLGGATYDTNISISGTVNGLTFSSTSPCASCGGISVSDNIGGMDRFIATSYFGGSIYAPVTGPSVDGFANYFLRLVLDDTNSTAFGSNALPSNLALSSFDKTYFSFSFLDVNANEHDAYGPLSSLSLTATPPVSEASTSAMLALGLGALGVAARRRKSH